MRLFVAAANGGGERDDMPHWLACHRAQASKTFWFKQLGAERMAQSVQRKNRSRRVLVADDDDVFRDRLVRALRERGWEACGARNAREAVELAQGQEPGCALLDLGMTDASGLEVLEALRALGPGTRIVIFTGVGSAASALDAVRANERGSGSASRGRDAAHAHILSAPAP